MIIDMSTINPNQQNNKNFNLQSAVTAAIELNQHISPNYQNTSKRQRNTADDFQLNKRQKKILELLPKCGWARRYINLIVNLGSLCEWKPYYRGEQINDPYLESIIKDIRPAGSSQRRMRVKALRLQATIGLYALTRSKASGRLAFQVWHPTVVEQARGNKELLQMRRSRQDQKDFKTYKTSEVRRFWTPDDMYEKEPYTDLYDVLDTMDLYCCALESVRSNAEQSKIFNNLLHLKLQNTDKNPFWSNPNNFDPKSGKLMIHQSIEDLNNAARAAYQGNGQARFSPYTLVWPDDVEHIKLNEPLQPAMIEAVNMIARQGAVALPAPTPFLSGEDGMENHWNNAENQRQLKHQTIQPNLETHDGFFTEYTFRPSLSNKLKKTPNRELFKKYKVSELEMCSDTATIDNKPDNSQMIFELFKEGVATRNQLAEAVGIESVLDLPDGMTEYDHWLCVKGKQAAMEPQPAQERVEAPSEPSIAAQAMALLS